MTEISHIIPFDVFVTLGMAAMPFELFVILTIAVMGLIACWPENKGK